MKVQKFTLYFLGTLFILLLVFNLGLALVYYLASNSVMNFGVLLTASFSVVLLLSSIVPTYLSSAYLQKHQSPLTRMKIATVATVSALMTFGICLISSLSWRGSEELGGLNALSFLLALPIIAVFIFIYLKITKHFFR